MEKLQQLQNQVKLALKDKDKEVSALLAQLKSKAMEYAKDEAVPLAEKHIKLAAKALLKKTKKLLDSLEKAPVLRLDSIEAATKEQNLLATYTEDDNANTGS